MQDFLELPRRIYSGDQNWVSPLYSEVKRTLDAAKNPYFAACDLQKFVAYQNGQAVARAITVINPSYWKKFGERVAFFGFFESVNEPGVAVQFFEEISNYCRQRGASHLEGPFNPNHYSELGLLVENFSKPIFFETYNPPYYKPLLETAGFKSIYDLHTRKNLNSKAYLQEHPTSNLKKLQSQGYTIRPFNLFRLFADLEKIREVFNDAFSENWHFLPVSQQEYRFLVWGLFLITRPKLIQIIEHHGKPVGVIQCVLNVNPLLQTLNGKFRFIDLFRLWRARKQIKEILIYAVGVKKAYQKGRVLKMLHAAMGELIQQYPAVYSTWIKAENLSAVKASALIGLVPYKWFQIFQKPL